MKASILLLFLYSVTPNIYGFGRHSQASFSRSSATDRPQSDSLARRGTISPAPDRWGFDLNPFATTTNDVELEASLSLCELVERRGYNCSPHEVVTTDGYILTVFHIGPSNWTQSPSRGREPMLLMHGLLDSAATFVTNFRTQSLAYVLVDAGFDVWLGNVRGSTYSRRHLRLDPDIDSDYWEFSFDDMARYDLPATVASVLNATGRSRLSYIGHSQGSLIMFIGLLEVPNLSSKVKLFAALAPVFRITQVRGLVANLTKYADVLAGVFSVLGTGEFLGSSQRSRALSRVVCGNEQLLGLSCKEIIFAICGGSGGRGKLNITRLPVYMSHAPAGTSVKNIRHLNQLLKSGTLQRYDYGLFGNFRHYHSARSPAYNTAGFNSVNTSIALYWSESDWLTATKDVQWLAQRLGPALVRQKTIERFGHLDFLWTINARSEIYDDLIELLMA